MDRKVKSFRLRVDLLDWVKAYAGTRGSTEIAVLETALANLKRDAEGGVPDLPEEPVEFKPAATSSTRRTMAQQMGWAP